MVDKTDYSDWTPKELIKEIKNLKQPDKFGITWEYKDEDVVELCKKN